MPFDIAIDFGETSVSYASRSLKEAQCVSCAVASRKGRILAMGEDAAALLGRAPREISVEYPLRQYQVANEQWITEWMKVIFSQCAAGARMRKASVLFTVSQTGGAAMERALRAAAAACEIASICAIDRSVAAWSAAGGNMEACEAGLLAWLDEGCACASLICHGAVQSRFCAPGGLGEIDRSIAEMTRRRYSLAIGPASAAELRGQLAAARAIPGVQAGCVGLDLTTGFPAAKDIPASLGEEASRPVCDELCQCLRRCASCATPESAADLCLKPILLSGPGAFLPGLESFISEATGLPCRAAQADMGAFLLRCTQSDTILPFCRKL